MFAAVDITSRIGSWNDLFYTAQWVRSCRSKQQYAIFLAGVPNPGLAIAGLRPPSCCANLEGHISIPIPAHTTGKLRPAQTIGLGDCIDHASWTVEGQARRHEYFRMVTMQHIFGTLSRVVYGGDMCKSTCHAILSVDILCHIGSDLSGSEGWIHVILGSMLAS